ncbi:CidA/LrgA family protein [Salinimonas sp. HHU 13199]|uniref:CidA/LrgA family protein n=1 Tax=Salinimonas profundi TaxID=2729140 RepID=A0ABR8LJG4_9ALTE|nr:CidA/LrgA family protein [Salinimonas profundi]MBD3585465.1 CidA/LrgA family protein [Salinimonas profundi]
MPAFLVNACRQCFGLLMLFVFYILGEVIVQSASLPLPGALVGLLLLLFMLLFLKRTPATIASGARPLLSHMTVLFVPAVCAVMLMWQDIEPYLMSISAAIFISTALSLGATAWVAVRIFLAAKGSQHHD